MAISFAGHDFRLKRFIEIKKPACVCRVMASQGRLGFFFFRYLAALIYPLVPIRFSASEYSSSVYP